MTCAVGSGVLVPWLLFASFCFVDVSSLLVPLVWHTIEYACVASNSAQPRILHA